MAMETSEDHHAIMSPDEMMLDANQQPPPPHTRQAASVSSWGSYQGPTMTGRPPKILYLSCNPDHLNDYQCLVRKNMEFFEATPFDLEKHVKGRNRPIVLGQVGIRCIHCRYCADPSLQTKGSTYYPTTLLGIYQAAQTLANTHWLGEGDDNVCALLPPFTRQQLLQFKTCAATERQHSAGKEYWANTAAALGVMEHPEWGLRFKELDYNQHQPRVMF
jgi:hypothetical protein